MTLWPMNMMSQLKSTKKGHRAIQREAQIGDPCGREGSDRMRVIIIFDYLEIK
jgi:hypothetical protein